MNENLMIPKQVQGILDEVENTPLYLAELPMEAHPKLPQFNRFIRVINFGRQERKRVCNVRI